MRPERRSAPPVLTEGRVPFLFYALIRDRCEAPSGACRRNCMRKALAGPFSVSLVGKGVVRGYARSAAARAVWSSAAGEKAPSGQTVGAFGGACGTPPSHTAASCRLVATMRRSFLPPLRSSAGSPRRFRRGQTAAASPAGAGQPQKKPGTRPGCQRRLVPDVGNLQAVRYRSAATSAAMRGLRGKGVSVRKARVSKSGTGMGRAYR